LSVGVDPTSVAQETVTQEPKKSTAKLQEPKNDMKDYVKEKGASLTFTYKEGLVV